MKGTKDILLEKIRSGVAMGALVGTASGIIAGGAIGFLSNGLKTSSPEIVSWMALGMRLVLEQRALI